MDKHAPAGGAACALPPSRSLVAEPETLRGAVRADAKSTKTGAKRNLQELCAKAPLWIILWPGQLHSRSQ